MGIGSLLHLSLPAISARHGEQIITWIQCVLLWRTHHFAFCITPHSQFHCLSLLPSTILWRMRPAKERSCQLHGLIVLPPLSRTSTVWVVKTLNDSLLWEESSKYAYCILSLYKSHQKLMHHLLKRIPFDSHTNYIFKKKKGFGWIPLNLVFFFFPPPLWFVCRLLRSRFYNRDSARLNHSSRSLCNC